MAEASELVSLAVEMETVVVAVLDGAVVLLVKAVVVSAVAKLDKVMMEADKLVEG